MPRDEGPVPMEPDPPDTSSPTSDVILGSRLRLIVTRLSRRLRQEDATWGGDLTATRQSALLTVAIHKRITIGELAAAERVQPPSMTRLVGTCEELGWLTRETDAHDRRICWVQITDAGTELLMESRNRREAFFAQLVARLSAEDRAILDRAL